MMTIDNFILYNLLMMGLTWYLIKTYGEKEYGEGITDAVQMHHEGTLKYELFFNEEGEEMLKIDIKPLEEEV